MNYSPFQTKIATNEIVLEQNDSIFSDKKYDRLFVYLKAGLRIAKAKFERELPLQGSEKEIIKQIHAIRFDEKNPYVITGGHFYQLFVRNLGIFYNALLDPRIPCTENDWIERQEIALKTVALDLEIFQQAGKEYTTIAPVRKNIFTCLNYYARPSDSLFAILYTLLALTDETFITTTFPAKIATKNKLQTKTAAQLLTKNYHKTLTQLVQTYYNDIMDPQTGLIKKSLLLASARDGIKRECSFYDNVIAWTTIRLAKRLNLYHITDDKLALWKKRIIHAFWDQKEGIFLDDLSELSQKEKLFSADSFIVTSTGFLHSTNSHDKKYLQQMVEYVKKYKLDEPFPLHYSLLDLPEKLYRPVRYAAPSYMGTSIWSHWGMEYIKTLIYLGQRGEAKKHLATYQQNIEQYGGYPELYDKAGKILHQRFYRSVLHNGWVINYEQTKMLLQNTKKLNV